MTATELEEILAPILTELENQSSFLESQIAKLEYLAQVQFGVIVGLGVIAGLILIYLLLRKF